MLKLYLGEESRPANMELNVENLFLRTALKYNDIENKIVVEIEGGRLSSDDEGSFFDRFGRLLPLNLMSTGCKAALCVLNNSDKIVSLLECGSNAIDTIVTHIKDGTVWIPSMYDEFWSDSDDIDVELDGYRFTSLEVLNTYLDTGEIE